MSSSRLPKKALLPILGVPLIERVIQQLIPLGKKYKIVLLTSDQKDDDDLAEVAVRNGIDYFRGSLHDVAKRTVQALKYYRADSFARVNGDCPIQKIELIEEAFERLERLECEIVSNVFKRTFPYGISAEVMDGKTFKSNYKHFNNSDKENIFNYFYRNSKGFDISCVILKQNSFDRSVTLTVDDKKTYDRMVRLFEDQPEVHKKSISEIVKIYKTIIQHD